MFGDDRNRLGQIIVGTGVVFVLTSGSSPIPSSANPFRSPTVTGVKLPSDAVFDRTVGPERAVTFRHATHFAAVGNRCTSCHPKQFRILSPTRVITHREMESGASCGVCHDGRHTFAVRDTTACALCHAGRPGASMAGAAATRGAPGGATAPPRGPAPIVYARGESSPGTVTFKHATHLGAKSECASCHPKPFAMKSAGARAGGGMHESGACGACHDGRRAFGIEDDASCARCHVGSGGTP